MQARMLIVLASLALVTLTLPFHGCGDNDNSSGAPCCPVCGDGVCNGDEHGCDCHEDCPRGGEICLPHVDVCGNGFCERVGDPGESHERCPADCPLDCRECAARSRVYVNGTVSPGDKCPVGTTFAYREDDVIVCNACVNAADCPDGLPCRTQCGPGCENDTGGCCPVRVCSP